MNAKFHQNTFTRGLVFILQLWMLLLCHGYVAHASIKTLYLYVCIYTHIPPTHVFLHSGDFFFFFANF